jgi:hypothetical protein
MGRGRLITPEGHLQKTMSSQEEDKHILRWYSMMNLPDGGERFT